MSRYLVLLPAPEAEWAELPPGEHEKGARAHRRFTDELRAGGHRVVESDDEAGLRAVCEQLASTGDLIELRRLSGDEH